MRSGCRVPPACDAIRCTADIAGMTGIAGIAVIVGIAGKTGIQDIEGMADIVGIADIASIADMACMETTKDTLFTSLIVGLSVDIGVRTMYVLMMLFRITRKKPALDYADWLYLDHVIIFLNNA